MSNDIYFVVGKTGDHNYRWRVPTEADARLFIEHCQAWDEQGVFNGDYFIDGPCDHTDSFHE